MSPDFKKTLLFQGAVEAAKFRRFVTGWMILFVGLTLAMVIGHALAPQYVGAVPPGLFQAAVLFSVFWLVFNALWALVNHLTTSLVRATLEGAAFTLAGAFKTLAQAEAPPAAEPTARENVAYMTDFLKERLDALDPSKGRDA